MVYNEKFVAVVKANGNVLREKGDVIYVPFGSEYSIALKNLNSVKAVVKISVDGDDTLDGNEIIVGANSTAELEGFMKGRKVSNKFKFIEKTDQIAEYRGNKVSDGLIRISFKFEAVVPEIPEISWPGPYYYVDNRGFGDRQGTGYPTWTSSTTKSSGIEPPIAKSYKRGVKCSNVDSPFDGEAERSVAFSAQSRGANRLGTLSSMSMLPANDAGITVKGSKSAQQFKVGSVGVLEDTEHIIVLNLKGKLKDKVVKKAVTVKAKVTCETCGKKSKSSNQFCNNCGTALF